MKRLMFLLVSAFFATTSYCANTAGQIATVFGNNDGTAQIEKQKKWGLGFAESHRPREEFPCRTLFAQFA